MSLPAENGERLAVIWHDLECGAYAADLAAWERLAAEAGGPVLDLGCGTGRVSLHLAARGHPVTAVDLAPELLAELTGGAASRQLPVRALRADACSLELGCRFPLVLAPMQLLQLLSFADRRSALGAISAHLEPGGRAAFAILGDLGGDAEAAPVPDIREIDGWVYSSRPVAVRREDAGLTVVRRRQAVSPHGEMTGGEDEVFLHALTADELAREAAAAGLTELWREGIEATEDHVGSVVCVFERAV